uniref:Uncharacterized protein n=1 Tax=Catagonus wagneri TaxID=51154 RepID=A0A8C3X2I0_9CETA
TPSLGTSTCHGCGPFPLPLASPKVKDKDIFRRATKKSFGSFSGSAQACNLPQGLSGRYLQPVKLRRGILLLMLFLDRNFVLKALENQPSSFELRSKG